MEFIFGVNPVEEALKSKQLPRKIIVLDHLSEKNKKIAQLIKKAISLRVRVEQLHINQFNKIAGTQKAQGIIAETVGYQYSKVEDIFEYASKKNEAPLILITDGIEDPHNLGAIIRNAECAGIHGVIITRRHSAGINATVAKTSSGAIFHQRIVLSDNLARTIEYLKEKNVWVCGTHQNGDLLYFQADFKTPTAIVIGSEGQGIRNLIKKKCDFLVKIPQKGKISSLNASVSAALVSYEAIRQREYS